MATLVISSLARIDITLTISWSEQTFGPSASSRYEALLLQAMRDVAEDPARLGVEPVRLRDDLRTYRLYFSRNRVADPLARVKQPRHVLLIRPRADEVEVLRILHDSMDLERHLPPEEDS
ncbi:MAG TPA: type II toxin-antitoxin system RelE/ParE family toxin [Pirellulaceae bacterium]|nr:type II toxin-antitoxin system RelE/ParE family toxin [Pirellulaceae bacterium]